jgi:hypothetical protein
MIAAHAVRALGYTILARGGRPNATDIARNVIQKAESASKCRTKRRLERLLFANFP